MNKLWIRSSMNMCIPYQYICQILCLILSQFSSSWWIGNWFVFTLLKYNYTETLNYLLECYSIRSPRGKSYFYPGVTRCVVFYPGRNGITIICTPGFYFWLCSLISDPEGRFRFYPGVVMIGYHSPVQCWNSEISDLRVILTDWM